MSKIIKEFIEDQNYPLGILKEILNKNGFIIKSFKNKIQDDGYGNININLLYFYNILDEEKEKISKDEIDMGEMTPPISG